MTKFMRETAERAIKTAERTALALFDAALVSVLTSVASLPVGPPDSLSVVE